MRLAPLARRSVSVLAATALLTTGAAATGLVDAASAASGDQPLKVAPQFKGNTDSDANNATLTLSTTGQDFNSSGTAATVTLTSVANGVTYTLSPLATPVVNASRSGTTVQYRSLTARFDLMQQPPGVYDAKVVDAGTAPTDPSTTYSCSGCFTVNGFTPTVSGFAKDTAPNAAPDAFVVSGTDFARGSVVSFEKGGAKDPALAFSYTDGSSTAPKPNPTANTISGSFTVGATAVGGPHDVVVTNTDGKRGVCVGCYSVPLSGTVYRSDQSPTVRAALGQGATAHLIVKGSGFTTATAAAFSTPHPVTTTVANVNVARVNLVDASTLDLTVAVDDTSSNDPSSVDNTVRTHSLTLTTPGSTVVSVPAAVTVSPRPTVDYDPVAGTSGPSETAPGVGSTSFPIAITGSGFQPGAVASFAPAIGITVKSFTPTPDGAAGTVVVDVAADAPLTTRSLVVTNPDLGVDTGGCSGCITPVAAPVLTSASPLSFPIPTSGSSTVDLTLNASRLTQHATATRKIAFPDDPAIGIGAITDNDDPTGTLGPDPANQVYVTLTIPSTETPGPKRLFYTDGNGARVTCTTPSGGECFTLDNLTVSAVSPSFGTNDAPRTVTVTGANFSALPTAVPTVALVRAGQPDLVASSVSVTGPTSLSATIDLSTAAPVTNGWSVRVTNPDGGTGILRDSFTITGNQPTLAVVMPLTPAAAPAGGQKLITVKGTNFARGGALSFAPAATLSANEIKTLSSTFTSTASYQFLLQVPAGAAVGPRNVTYRNTDGKTVTCNACFTVNPGPAVSQVSPASRAPGSAQTVLTIADTSSGSATAYNGTPTVTFDTPGITAGTATAVTAKSFQVPVTVAPGTPLGRRKITVTNGDGGVASCASCFSVAPLPSVLSITPAALKRGTSNATVTVTGSGFGTAPSLDLGPGVTIGTTTPSTDGTSLTAVVSVASTATPRGLRDVKVTNTDATNGGSASRPSAFGIGDVPGAPTLSAPGRLDRAVSLSWTAPTDDGGLPISSYTVTVTKTADGTAVSPTISYQGTTALVSGLVNGTSYTFTVKATNPVGTGAESTPRTAVPARTPDAPTGVLATAGDGAASVAFTVPTGAATGGDPVLDYTVTSSPDGVTAIGSTSPIAVPGLTNGTSYTFTVTARNTVGSSVPSAASNAVTPLGAKPGAPTALAADPSAKAGQVVLTWTAPTAATLTPVTSYRVTVSPAAGTVAYPTDRSSTGATVTGLTNGTAYTFAVLASTSASSANPGGGEGPASAPATGTPYDVPGAPTGVTGARSDSAATVTWTAPTSDGGRPVTGYTVTLSPGGASQTVTGTSATFAGLTNGTSYTASVVATNARGNGPAGTSAAAFTPATTPGAPTGVTATPAPASAKVSWTAPASNGGTAITRYTVTSSPGGATATTSGTATSATVTGLSNAMSYTFTVVATNAVGDGPASTPSGAVTPMADVAPNAPTGVTVAPGDRRAVVSFTAPADNGGSPVTSYTVSATPDSGPPVTATGTSSPITVTGLTNGTRYTVTVSAVNSTFTGTASDPSAAFTPKGTSTLTFVALPSIVNYAGAIVVKGKVTRTDTTAPSRGTVVIRSRDDRGVSVVVGTVAVNADGTYSRTLTGYVNRTYTVQYGGDSHVTRSAISAGRRTTVHVKITASHPATSSHTTAYTVTGSVYPNKAGTTISLYRVNSNGTLSRLGSATITSKGSYAIRVALSKGSYSLRLAVPATTGNASSVLGFTAKRT